MEKQLQPCCDDLPQLSQQEIFTNIGNHFSPSNQSPSLYEELFDEKRFSDLINDPLLNTGQMDVNKSGKQTSEHISSTNSAGLGSASSQPFSQGAENGSSMWNNNGTYYQNGFGNGGSFFDATGTGETSGHVQQIAPTRTSQYATSSWSDGQLSEANTITMSKPLASSNSVPQPTMGQRPSAPFVRVKMEPQESVISSSEQDRDDYNYSAGSQPSSSMVSRGAVYAREYRRKNKNRVTKLEQDNERLWRENESLKEAYREACAKSTALSREVTYLRQVLANDGAIATLLNTVVSNAPGLKFQCPLISDQRAQETAGTSSGGASKRRVPEGIGPNITAKQRKIDENEVRKVRESVQKSGDSPGVCLHVNNDMVSVEFCPRCNRDARRGAGDLQ